jgi:hypothetical protein
MTLHTYICLLDETTKLLLGTQKWQLTFKTETSFSVTRNQRQGKITNVPIYFSLTLQLFTFTYTSSVALTCRQPFKIWLLIYTPSYSSVSYEDRSGTAIMYFPQ